MRQRVGSDLETVTTSGDSTAGANCVDSALRRFTICVETLMVDALGLGRGLRSIILQSRLLTGHPPVKTFDIAVNAH